MGSANNYRCTNCGYAAKWVTEPFDFGFSGDVTTPVVCPTHHIVPANTGLNAQNAGWEAERKTSYPCPRCEQDSHLWNGKTCPACGEETLDVDPEGGLIMWD